MNGNLIGLVRTLVRRGTVYFNKREQLFLNKPLWPLESRFLSLRGAFQCICMRHKVSVTVLCVELPQRQSL